MKKKNEIVFVCSSCGNEFSKWVGQCSACGEWNSLREIPNFKSQITNKFQNSNHKRDNNVRNLGKVGVEKISEIFSSGIGELDRVLGRGIVPGSVILFSGEPGVGKSTILTKLIGNVSGLYVAGEEGMEQIRLRVERMKLKMSSFDILESNLVEEICEVIVKNNYRIVVVDSIQMMASENVTSMMGSVGQIRECTFRLIEVAKKTGTAIFIVGHITKDGDIAGPKLLEHMVDTVLYFEGERNSDLRLLRCNKNRFGANDEVGVFKMEETGLREIKSDEINLIDSDVDKVGSAISLVMEGTRPMMIEIQALVVESFGPMPKRIFSGVDYNRGQLLVAVAQKTLGLPLYKYDVFVAVSGGIKISDTAADLAVIASIYSSYTNKSLGLGVYVGEVSLLGEVKRVKMMEKRQKEIQVLGKVMIDIRNVRELKRTS